MKLVFEALLEEDGTISGVIALADDITAQVLARKKIEESEEKFRIALEGGKMGTFDYYPQTGKLEWSHRAKELFGIPSETPASYDLYLDVLHPEDRANSLNLQGHNHIFENGGLYELEYRVIGKTDGRIRWIRSNGKITYDVDGNPVRHTGVVRDITERKIATQALKGSEERFRLLAEKLPHLVWETDEKGLPLYASGRWKEYSGVNPDSEDSWKMIVHPDDLESTSKNWINSLATGNIYRSEVRLRGKTGEYRWFTVFGQPVLDDHSQIIKWIGAFTDIHAEKSFAIELEKQVENRTRELEQVNRALAAKNIELEKMNKELESFAYVSSHDLQEPLRKIQTFATRLLEKEASNLSEQGKDHFRRMQGAAERMQQLINDLLSYSRTSTFERVYQKVDLQSLVDDVKEDLKDELKQKAAVIETSGLTEVNVIAFQFRQLMNNLISNSLKFSREGIAPVIKIKAELVRGSQFANVKPDPDKEYCHITVSDNGIGFEPEYNEKIFEVFQRLHGRSEYSGTGIGLAIVKKIVDNHSGFVSAKGRLNEGATFDIYIPSKPE